jgi:hypothetical protein
MAYNPSGQSPIKSPEIMAIEEYHRDMAVARMLKLGGANTETLLKDAECLLEEYYDFFIAGSDREEKVKKLREEAKSNKNQFALMKGIRRMIRQGAIEAGYYGGVKTATYKNPDKMAGRGPTIIKKIFPRDRIDWGHVTCRVDGDGLDDKPQDIVPIELEDDDEETNNALPNE